MVASPLGSTVEYCAFHAGTEEAERRLREILTVQPRVRAICTGAGDLTLVVLAVAREMGIPIGSDLALVGFDDHPYYQYISPPVTAADGASRP